MLSSRRIKKIIIPAILLGLLIILNAAMFPRFGYKLRYDSGQIKFGNYKHYSKNDSKILALLINETPNLGKIPGFGYLSEKAEIGRGELIKSLEILEGYGDIEIVDDSVIVAAGPWNSEYTDYIVILYAETDSIIGPMYAKSALHSLVAASYFGRARIAGVLTDTNTPLNIRIENNKITYTSHIPAVMFTKDDYNYSKFYSAPDAVENYHSPDFNRKQVFRLDRALNLSHLMAEELRKKTDEK